MIPNWSVRTVSLILLANLLCAPSHADEEDLESPSPATDDAFALSHFTKAKLAETVNPTYPRRYQRQGKEGWAQMHMMVGPDGKAYEVVVTDSSGHQGFEEAAVAAVEKWKFDPAALNGQAIDAAVNYKIVFSLEGGRSGAGRRFRSAYNKFISQAKDGDQETTKSALAILEQVPINNLYEEAFLNLARYEYLRRWGSKKQQLVALKSAIAYETNNRFLEKSAFRSSMIRAFALEVDTLQYANALKRWQTLKKMELSAGLRTSLQAAVDKILALQKDDRSFKVSGRIPNDYSWYHQLLKHEFYLENVQGELAELKLRCDADYVFTRYQPEQQYIISPSAGACHLQITGDPDTTFDLVQR